MKCDYPIDIIYNNYMKLRRWQLEANLTLPDSYVSMERKQIIRSILSLSDGLYAGRGKTG